MAIRTRGRLAAVVAGPVLVAVAAATAGAHSGPEEGSRYTDRRTHTGPDGARVTETTSCVDKDGEVYYERRTRSADAGGENTRTRRSGNPAACAQDTRDGRSADRTEGLVTVNAPVQVEGVAVLGGDVGPGPDRSVAGLRRDATRLVVDVG